MKRYTQNDLLDLEIKYKDNDEVLDLINFIKSDQSVVTGATSVTYSSRIQELENFISHQASCEFRDGLNAALRLVKHGQ